MISVFKAKQPTLKINSYLSSHPLKKGKRERGGNYLNGGERMILTSECLFVTSRLVKDFQNVKKIL